MKFIKLTLFITINTLLLSSCITNVPLSNTFFENNKTVGIVYIIDSINVYRSGSQGLLDMALTSGNGYMEPLSIIESKVDPTDKVKVLHNNFLTSKNKKFIEIDYKFEKENLVKFKAPDDSNNESKIKYHNYDLRHLKEKGIDELIIINVKYGLLVDYYSFHVNGRYGHCIINSEIVNLDDNSILYKNYVIAKSDRIKGEWETPPNYEKLEISINNAINSAINQEEVNLNKQQ